MKSLSMNNEKSSFIRLANKIQNLNHKIDSIPGKKPEFVACILYVITHLLMAIVHEPWYDEAVAWQIARCASIKELLFEIPHYEGHPPLWHLILLPFAKLGAPYELSLSIVSLIFAGTACCLIIWKAPFSRIIRLLLPFTYFFFFQYGVVVRPYCVMMLVFVLLAIAYQNRNTKPGTYVALLMLLCLTSAYGILIAGGLTIAWILEMWNFQNIGSFIKSILKDKRSLFLLILLVFALLLIAMIMPRDDTYATNLMSNYIDSHSFLFCMLYMLLALPLEVSMTAIYADGQLLKVSDIPLSSLIITCVIGVLVWSLIIIWGKQKKTLLTLLIPYALYAVFAAFIYIYPHHIGVGLLILVFWFWISVEKQDEVEFLSGMPLQVRKILKSMLVILGCIAMIISLWWNISSCITDVFQTYATGRKEAKFIKENGLDDYRMMVGWSAFFDENGNMTGMDINHCNCADSVAPYFENNLFFNFNNGDDSLNYSTHKFAGEEETAAAMAEWKKELPDVLYMYPRVTLIYEDVDWSEYKLVYFEKNNKVWKGFFDYSYSKIYVHEDLIESLGLEPSKNGETYEKILWLQNNGE